DGDGKFTRAELRRAPQALRKYDLNEDEKLELAELLPATIPSSGVLAAGVKQVAPTKASSAVLRIDIGIKPMAPAFTGNGANRLLAAPGDGVHRLSGPDGTWALTFRTARVVPDMRGAGEFLIAQFESALGNRAALMKADIEADPALGGHQE